MDGDLRSLILKSDCRLLVTLQWDHIDISIWKNCSIGKQMIIIRIGQKTFKHEGNYVCGY
jgi:hypothetical protein